MWPKAISDYRIDTMEKNIEKILVKLDEMSTKFATKEDHKENSNKINELEKSVTWINLKIALVTGWFSAVIFIIEKIWK